MHAEVRSQDGRVIGHVDRVQRSTFFGETLTTYRATASDGTRETFRDLGSAIAALNMAGA